jgi:hypothetical protein
MSVAGVSFSERMMHRRARSFIFSPLFERLSRNSSRIEKFEYPSIGLQNCE